MPRTILVQGLTDAPLTVTAVAHKLGVSASTLRTWERRYGLGPDDRHAGAHRRYRQTDVARLTRMVQLIHAGVTPADAAQTVRDAPDCVVVRDVVADSALPTDAASLRQAARRGDADLIRRMLEVCVVRDGLVHTWCNRIAPVLDDLLDSPDGQQPGHAPSATLCVVALDVVRAVGEQCRPEGKPPAVQVAILTDQDHQLAANVVGVALLDQGVRGTVLTLGTHRGRSGAERFRAFAHRHEARVAVVMGRGGACEKTVEQIRSATGRPVDLVLVGTDAPAVLAPHVQRVRTLAAGVEETIDLARSLAGERGTGGRVPTSRAASPAD